MFDYLPATPTRSGAADLSLDLRSVFNQLTSAPQPAVTQKKTGTVCADGGVWRGRDLEVTGFGDDRVRR